jgi:hypothetical protein
MRAYEQAKGQLLAHAKVWLIAGVAGFIGSNLAENISRFAAELRIGARTPTLPTSQTQMVLAHDPPALILTHLAQMLGKQSPVPA